MNLIKWALFSTVLASSSPIMNSVLAITSPSLGNVLNAGNEHVIRWATSPVIPKVDIILRSGNQADLTNELQIATHVSNTGSYIWHIPESMKTSTGLSIMIHDSRDPSIGNYSPYFTILSSEYSPASSKVVSSTEVSSGIPNSIESHRPTETIRVHISEKHPHRILDGEQGEALDSQHGVKHLIEEKSFASSSKHSLESSEGDQIITPVARPASISNTQKLSAIPTTTSSSVPYELLRTSNGAARLTLNLPCISMLLLAIVG